jgi:tRNA pseudouridine(55) synthase
MELPPYIVLEKSVGQTPLQCVELWRQSTGVDTDVPLAYAGRLDPMASGKLLILIGDECKNQAAYHGLDKAYDFSVLLGIGSDTHDVLGRLHPQQNQASDRSDAELATQIQAICQALTGDIELPYPLFSSKTIQGKPLLVWTLENRLDEITIPTKQSTVYYLELSNIETKSRADVCTEARTKIDSIPPVTELSKAIGNDFRRVDVRQDWVQVAQANDLPNQYHIAHFHCIASSGTYMRTLASVIGERLDTKG